VIHSFVRTREQNTIKHGVEKIKNTWNVIEGYAHFDCNLGCWQVYFSYPFSHRMFYLKGSQSKTQNARTIEECLYKIPALEV